MSQEIPAPVSASSFRSRWASIAIRDQIAEIQDGIPSLRVKVSRHKLVPLADTLFEGRSGVDQRLKVGIIGAGCAGLFTAMIFDHLKKTYGLDVDYEILETNGKERLGGRLFSHYFKDKHGESRKHDYYDVGAMRFPDIDIMKRTFALFKECKMEKYTGTDPAKGNLVQYFLSGPNTPILYNGVQVVPPYPLPKDPAGKTLGPTGKSFDITGLPEEYVEAQPGDLISKQIKRFVDQFKKDPKQGWKYLMDNGDKSSVRQYLTQEALYDYNTLEWLETYNYGNRWYDQAFSEMVLEDLDFNHDKPWWCIEGGAQQLAYNMHKTLSNQSSISFNTMVSSISFDDIKSPNHVDLQVKGEPSPRRYDAVFNSAPLGAMQRMDLTGLNLNWGTKQAIRSLGYGASCKVGIRFKTLWWINPENKLNINNGGVAKTDLPLRVCVYPSYNIHDPTDQPGVLLCSYTWSQEAQRIASLINHQSPSGEEELKDLLIHNLAKLHSRTNDPDDYARLYALIAANYDTHHAYDWYADRGTTGAFAYFGPGQFRNMYPWIVRSEGKHVIIGEAASAHHAWVVGALESAVRGVYQFLARHTGCSEGAERAFRAYNEGEVVSPFGPLPYEYDRETDVKPVDPAAGAADTGAVAEQKPMAEEEITAHLAVEGEWAREQVLFENIRLQQGGDQLDSTKVQKEQIQPLLQAVAAA